MVSVVRSSGATPLADVSIWERVQLGHAAVQYVAERAKVDVLHIKGPALDRAISPKPRYSTDADVLVRPSQVGRLIDMLCAQGWVVQFRFGQGSPFEHAATLLHSQWGLLDVHRWFPGLPRGESTFDALWTGRHTLQIAGVACPVPSLLAQRLIVLLHAARGDSPRAAEDLQRLWTTADTPTRTAVAELADRLGAQVGFAAVTGHLDDYRDTPEGRMWMAFRSDGPRLEEWGARLRLASSWRWRVHVLGGMLSVSKPFLRSKLGRDPQRAEVAQAWFARLATGAGEAVQLVLKRLRGVR